MKKIFQIQTKQLVEKLIYLAKKRVNEGRLLKSGTYMAYIDYLRKKPIRDKSPTEKHHILPRYEGGTDDASNLIRISVKDHILEHLIRYLEFGQDGDFKAYSFRRYSPHVDLSTRSKKVALLHKINGTGFYNSELQRKLGQRGGIIGGSKNTPVQYAARSKVGLTYGAITGISNQSSNLKETLASTLVFTHKKPPNEVFIIPPSTSGADVKRKLITLCEQLNRSELTNSPLRQINKGAPFMDY